MSEAPKRSDARFPPTARSAVLGVASADLEVRRRSWERLARAYDRPVYTHLRRHHRKEPSDAADLAQSFFARCLESDLLAGYDPSRARFRTYLRLTLDHFVVDRARAERAQKRGGGQAPLSLDFDGAERDLAAAGAIDTHDPAQAFDAAWNKAVLAMSVDGLRAHCESEDKREHFACFERFDLEGDETYESLAAELGLTVVTLTHRLAYARRHFRRIVLEVLRELTATDEELRDEARALLGVEVS